MKPDAGCERVRPRLMAAIDGETDAASAADREHLSGCAACREWLSHVERMSARLERLVYPDARVDLWASLEPRIREFGAKPSLTRRLWIIGAVVLAWRVLQLLFDLPLPALHPLVPLAAAMVAAWELAGDALAVRTFAPELQKRGV